MKLYAPSYYEKFKCIGGECPDNCCIGWQIDVDADMRQRYERLDAERAERICESIYEDECGAHFRLSEGGRCPHLNGSNLCNIILRHGEDMLCDVCREHPRYYSQMFDRVEVGVGLACPAAAELILDCKELTVVESGETRASMQEQNRTEISPTKSERLAKGAQELLLVFRDCVWSMMRQVTPRGVVLFADYLASTTLSDLLFDLSAGFLIKEECLRRDYFLSKPIRRFPYDARAQRESVRELLGTLEMLEANFGEELVSAFDRLPEVSAGLREFLREGGGEYFNRLLFYFTHRHLSDGIDDGSVHLRLRIAVIYAFSVVLLAYLRGGERQSVLRAAIDFSRNVEYSDENLDILLDALDQSDEAGVGFIADVLP